MRCVALVDSLEATAQQVKPSPVLLQLETVFPHVGLTLSPREAVPTYNPNLHCPQRTRVLRIAFKLTPRLTDYGLEGGWVPYPSYLLLDLHINDWRLVGRPTPHALF